MTVETDAAFEAFGGQIRVDAAQIVVSQIAAGLAGGFGVGESAGSVKGQQHAAQNAIEQAAAAIETAELNAADERLRMAQDLHDILAHSLSVIAVQAGIGAHLIDRAPLEASRALDAIRATCDTTKSELTRLVGILRNGAVTDSTSAPTIADLVVLVEQIRSADLPVTLTINGDLTAVPPGVSLAVYRIVQAGRILGDAERDLGHRELDTRDHRYRQPGFRNAELVVAPDHTGRLPLHQLRSDPTTG